MQETWVQSLGWDYLEKEMATHSCREYAMHRPVL